MPRVDLEAAVQLDVCDANLANLTCKSDPTAAMQSSAEKEQCEAPRYEDINALCAQVPCTTYAWQQSAFTECNVGCGQGWRTTTVACVSSAGGVVADSLCSADKPAEFILCSNEACDTPYYEYGPWGPCSSDCGSTGERSRAATCFKAGTSGEEDASACGTARVERQALTRNCNRRPCDELFWTSGAWTACVDGARARDVICMCASAACRLHARSGSSTRCLHFRPGRRSAPAHPT